MEQTRETPKTTTIAADATVRDYIASEAERQGLSQRQMLSALVKAYQHQAENPDIQRDEDRIISFLLKQEKRLIVPILITAQSVDSRLKVLIDILKDIE